MHRFFINKDSIINDEIVIKDDEVKHIKNSLRLNEDDIITVCDGEKKEYKVKISEISNDYVKGIIIDDYIIKSESNIDIVLYQGLPKSSKMDLIIQKCTELGVTKIVPVITSRTVVKISDKKKEHKKVERWTKIAKEASKQSKRGKIPNVEDIISFSEMLNNLCNEENIIVPYENENKTGIKQILKKTKGRKINIIIGPEGGFEEEEINELKKLNAKIVTLGPRILRTETAGFTAITIVMYELGDLG